MSDFNNLKLMPSIRLWVKQKSLSLGTLSLLMMSDLSGLIFELRIKATEAHQNGLWMKSGFGLLIDLALMRMAGEGLLRIRNTSKPWLGCFTGLLLIANHPENFVTRFVNVVAGLVL
jgi:hypothetical protein